MAAFFTPIARGRFDAWPRRHAIVAFDVDDHRVTLYSRRQYARNDARPEIKPRPSRIIAELATFGADAARAEISIDQTLFFIEILSLPQGADDMPSKQDKPEK